MALARPPTSAATRSFISPAALLVKVIARISPGCDAALGEQVGDAAGQHPGLAGAGAGDDEQRATCVDDGSALLRVQALEESGHRLSILGAAGDTAARPPATRPPRARSWREAYDGLMIPDTDVERVLVVTAHPDDVDFGAAGTIATWTDAGIEVVYCICTDGDAGGFDPAVPRSEIGGIRQEEQRAAAKVVGVTELHFLGYPDGELVATLELRRDISRVIRQVRPQRVVSSSPERDYERIGRSHPDHRAAGDATLDAVYPDARNPFAHPELLEVEGLEAWTVPEVWIAGGHRADALRRRHRDLRPQDRRAAGAREPDRAHGRPRLLRRWLAVQDGRTGGAAGGLLRRVVPRHRDRLMQPSSCQSLGWPSRPHALTTRVGRSHQAAVGGPAGQLVPVGQLELAQHRRHVRLDRLDRQHQLARHLLVGVAPGDQA